MLTLALLAAVIVPAGESFRCTPVRVSDGDGPIRCAERSRLRIAASKYLLFKSPLAF